MKGIQDARFAKINRAEQSVPRQVRRQNAYNRKMATTYVLQSNVFAVSLFIGMCLLRTITIYYADARAPVLSRDDDNILSPMFSKDSNSALETKRTRDVPSRMNNATCVAGDTNLVNVVHINVVITLRIKKFHLE